MTPKNPTSWIPQPMGFGYVAQATPLQLVTQTGAALVTQTGAGLKTGIQTVTGKYATAWSNTGS